MSHRWIVLAGALTMAGCPDSGADASEPASDQKKSDAKKSPGQASNPAASKTNESGAASYKPEEALRDPTRATLTAPDKFAVKLSTTKGDIMIDVERAWAPRGADRFYNLVRAGYYEDVAFFRVIGGFMAQFGISGEPALNEAWRPARIPDDPVKESNGPGYLTFAMGGPNTRTTQLFINFVDNQRLDGMGFAPIGKVRDASMKVVNKLHAGYGEGAPRGQGPAQGRIQAEGNAYLKKEFPNLDYILKAEVVES